MNFKTGFIALALMGLGVVTVTGCGNACDDLADALSDCAGAEGEGEGEGECTEEAEAFSQCYLDNVADVCAPTLEELADCA